MNPRRGAPDPCTEDAREQGCTCTMERVHSAMIDPPEPVTDRDCPLHGWAPDPDHARDLQIEDAMFEPEIEDDFA